MTEAVLDRHIEITPGVRDGKPRIAGRGITVADVVLMHSRLGMSLEEIAGKYDLSLAAVHAAMAYYYDHKYEMDKSIEEGEAFAESIRAEYPSLLQEKLKALLGNLAGNDFPDTQPDVIKVVKTLRTSRVIPAQLDPATQDLIREYEELTGRSNVEATILRSFDFITLVKLLQANWPLSLKEIMEEIKKTPAQIPPIKLNDQERYDLHCVIKPQTAMEYAFTQLAMILSAMMGWGVKKEGAEEEKRRA